MTIHCTKHFVNGEDSARIVLVEREDRWFQVERHFVLASTPYVPDIWGPYLHREMAEKTVDHYTAQMYLLGYKAGTAEAEPQIATDTKEEDGTFVGGVFVGPPINDDLFAEPVANARWVIRQSVDTSFAKRLGEVMGGKGRYQAMRMDGSHVGMGPSLLAAAIQLAG